MFCPHCNKEIDTTKVIQHEFIFEIVGYTTKPAGEKTYKTRPIGTPIYRHPEDNRVFVVQTSEADGYLKPVIYRAESLSSM